MRHVVDRDGLAHPWVQAESCSTARGEDCGDVTDGVRQRPVDVDLGDSNNRPTNCRRLAVAVSIAVTLATAFVPSWIVDLKSDFPPWPTEVKMDRRACGQHDGTLGDRCWEMLSLDFYEYSLLKV